MSLHEPPQRLSRYRSVRRQNAPGSNAQQAFAEAHACPPPPLPSVPQLDPSAHTGALHRDVTTQAHPSARLRPSAHCQHSGTVYPQRKTELRLPHASPRPAQQKDTSPFRQQSNGAPRRTSSSPQPASPIPPTPDLENITVQTAQPVQMQPVHRSLSRYHKKTRPDAASAKSKPMNEAPPMPADAGLFRSETRGDDGKRTEELQHKAQGSQVDRVTEGSQERNDRRHQQDHNRAQQQMPEMAQLPFRTTNADTQPQARGARPTMSQTPQAHAGAPATALHPSRSRYRQRQAPTAREPLPESDPSNTANDQPPMILSQTLHSHRDALRKLQRQASRPTSAQTPPAHGLLTKASLDRLPDDTNDENAASLRRVSHIKAQGADRRRREEQQAEDPKKMVMKLLDAEAKRHRRMHARIQAQREREEAAQQNDGNEREKRLRQVEERQQERERVLAEREKQLEERERQAKQEETHEATEASVSRGRRTREEQTKTLERTDPGSPHKRKESKEDRTERHRKRSLSALEGKPIHRQKSDEKPPPVPAPPPEPADSRVPLVNFLKKRTPTDVQKPLRIDRSKSVKKPERRIEPEGTTTAPGIDAPISAVNAGERRVLVECNKSSIFLPVTPSTTPSDLIRSAATCLTENISPKVSVLLESFGKIGVQRPLRKYERIRDVINSWDHDGQNSLILVSSATITTDESLEASSVPSAQPGDFSCQLYYSTKPGKWDKKWVTLRSDGQMLYSKSEGHKDPKDVTNICHMTDFDIYTPDHSSRGKKIRPPKKLCFVTKSQQKSNLFMSLENYAHLFSTSDKRLASEWYQAIHGWRSWYLVNVLGEGQKIEQRKPDASNADGPPLLPQLDGTRKAPGSRDSHYRLGSFKPLLDLDPFASNGEQPAVEAGNLVSHARNESSGGPPSAFPKWLVDNLDSGQPSNHMRNAASSDGTPALHRSGTLKHTASVKRTASQRRKPSEPAARDPKLNANLNPEDSTFAAGGLLGRSYSTRQRAQAEPERNGPFLTGGLLDIIGSASNVNGYNSPTPQTTAANVNTSTDHTGSNGADLGLSRSKSRRDPTNQRPLLDLHSNSYTEAPQHIHKGRGSVPDTVGTGGLVDLATSPERNAGAAPPPRPTTRDENQPLTLGRSKSRHNRESSPDAVAFNPTGLISTTDARQSKTFWNPNTSTQGRGIMDGSKANGPMLDVKEESLYAEGSLLRKVEGERPRAPVIDRGKEREVVVGTGEGL